MQLVIVESPSKAETIQKYLGRDYEVLASFGHTMDLPPKPGSVEPDKDFLMHYAVTPKAKKSLDKIYQKAAKAKAIYLATDPDREGEGIAWHIAEALKGDKVVKADVPIKRISFNEITKEAILNALKSARDLNLSLVNAQQARRALDYLVGFTLSPVLWRKMPGCRSAGRVQSVALRLICDREREIRSFNSQEYWDVLAELIAPNGNFQAKLVHTDQKIEKFTIASEQQANELAGQLETQQFSVDKISVKQQKRKPVPPFITSTLQQEGVKKLGFSAKKVMSVAQKLYEGIKIDGEKLGLITYMRTDGINMSKEAVDSCRTFIGANFGADYLSPEARVYRSKAKNAQEAHEAIRPTNISLTPDNLVAHLLPEELKLYTLIWRRAVASQMSDAVIENISVKIATSPLGYILQAGGSSIKFDGYYKVYKDDVEVDSHGEFLRGLKEKETLQLKNVIPQQHFTEPPPKYNEASLVKKLEELGIGRPSTYATIPTVLQERGYVTSDKKRLISAERGQLVTAFLEHFFAKYVDYNFTADLENGLDSIAAGDIEWKALLHDFWQGFETNITEVKDQKLSEVIEALNSLLQDYLFTKDERGNINRQCSCGGTLSLKLSKFGGFIACSNYPSCTLMKPLTVNDENTTLPTNPDKLLGQWQQRDIYLKKGPYGWYLELAGGGEKVPKRISVPAQYKPEEISEELAQDLISLPKLLGTHPVTAEDVTVNIGKFGPYVRAGTTCASIPSKVEPFKLELAEAVRLIDAKNQKERAKKA